MDTKDRESERSGDRSAEEAPKVKVRAAQAHTAFGQAYEIGDEYDVDPVYIDSLKMQGKAFPTETYPAPAPAPLPARLPGESDQDWARRQEEHTRRAGRKG